MASVSSAIWALLFSSFSLTCSASLLAVSTPCALLSALLDISATVADICSMVAACSPAPEARDCAPPATSPEPEATWPATVPISEQTPLSESLMCVMDVYIGLKSPL